MRLRKKERALFWEWISELMDVNEDLTNENLDLLNENENLKNEVAEGCRHD